MKDGDHDAGDRHADACLNNQDAEMLALNGVVGQNGVIQEAAAHCHADHTDRGIGESAQRHQHARKPFRHQFAATRTAFNQRIENYPCGYERACLKTAAWSKVTMKLNIQAEQDDERHQHLADNAWDEMMTQIKSTFVELTFFD